MAEPGQGDAAPAAVRVAPAAGARAAAAGAREPGPRDAYRSAGVDVDAGERAVALMRASVASTRRPEVIGGLGGFGGAFAIPAGYRDPILVASTDGVGTKTAIARALERFDTLGIDLVAMCADDVVCAGAEPLAFLDYVAVGRLVPERVADVVAGVAAGCREAGCALVGGETAEHPGTMGPDDLDLAGTCIGVAERADLLDGSATRAGDALIGLAASGLHSNGFSLVRRIVDAGDLDTGAPFVELAGRWGIDASADRIGAAADAGATLGDVLLAPTRIYARTVLAVRRALRAAGHDLHGAAHVTGGGLPGNVPRMMPLDLGARLRPSAWPLPAVMRLLGAVAGLADEELRATFNGGLGMVLAVPGAAVAVAVTAAEAAGVPAFVVGDVTASSALGGRRYAETIGQGSEGRQ